MILILKGHFLLTNLLLDLLKKVEDTRIITISSFAHKGSKGYIFLLKKLRLLPNF